MVDCPFLTASGTCRHVDDAVGEPIVIHPSACAYCVEKTPSVAQRYNSYPVRCWIRKERLARGMDGDYMPGKPEPAKVVAPIVADPQARLEICEECDRFDSMGRCRAPCSCKSRPRPLAPDGPSCPRRLWRRG